MAKSPTTKSTTPQPVTPSSRKRQKVAASRSAQSDTGNTRSHVRRVAQGTTPQKIVKPTTTPSATTLSTTNRLTRSQKRGQIVRKYSQDEATELLDAANHQSTKADKADDTQSESVQLDIQQSTPRIVHSVETTTAPVPPTSFSVQIPLRIAQDVDMTDVSDLSDMDEEALNALTPAEWDTSKESGQSSKARDCNAKKTVRKVHFAENYDVQPYSQAAKPTDVRSFVSFTQKTSDKLSFLRSQNIYDMKIRLEVRGAVLASAVVLTVADAKDMDALWAKVVDVEQNIDQPYQIQFKLDEDSQPAGYDASEDQKRFRFGKRAEDQLPEFIKRCQEAAHALAKEAERESEAEGVNGEVEVKNVVGVVELMWRG